MTKEIASLGFMSGTSLDGIDIAYIWTDGKSMVRRGPVHFYPYNRTQSDLLRQALYEATTASINDNAARPGNLASIEYELTHWHAQAYRSFLDNYNLTAPQLIGFHGQTILHRPAAGLSIQLGDGPLLARLTGADVCYNLRAADLAAGGQGAPLVPAYHRCLACTFTPRPAAFINIGGIANISWIGRDDQLIACDIGPGNALINDWCEQHLGIPYDQDGALAAQGQYHHDIIKRWLKSDFFERPAPKSLDRHDFSFIIDDLKELSIEDGLATLTRFTAQAIAVGQQLFPVAPRILIVCGGGRHNKTLVAHLKNLLPHITTAEDHGFNGDMLEAEAWAYLAVRSFHGEPLTYPLTTGVKTPMTGGIITASTQLIPLPYETGCIYAVDS